MNQHYHGFFRRQKTRPARACATTERRDEKNLATRLPRGERAAPRTRTNDPRRASPAARNRVKENRHKTKRPREAEAGESPCQDCQEGRPARSACPPVASTLRFTRPPA